MYDVNFNEEMGEKTVIITRSMVTLKGTQEKLEYLIKNSRLSIQNCVDSTHSTAKSDF